MFVRERRLSRVTATCLAAKTKADKEHTLEVLRTLTQAAGRDGEAGPVARVKRSVTSRRKRVPAAVHAMPGGSVESEATDPEASTAA